LRHYSTRRKVYAFRLTGIFIPCLDGAILRPNRGSQQVQEVMAIPSE
jgi:hypothetical protein